MAAIRPLTGGEEARRCAEMMCSTEPWITIGRNFNQSLAIVSDPGREVCVAAASRGCGLGTELVQFAEKRIFAETPNVFLCVSSFNPRARQLYERLGYELIGELKDYLIRGHSELLMRKTIGPLKG